LARHCDELYGIDIHPMQEDVRQLLASFNVSAKLFSGSVAALPFESRFFDCVIAVSSLEFVADLDAACEEIKRVLKPSGRLIVVTPGHSPIVDLGLKVLTGESAKKDYGDGRHRLMTALMKSFEVERRLVAPALGSSIIHLYTAMKLRARTASESQRHAIPA
jgi:ubiquinone/menaquinone biosynthesis C-methylase UbiE